MRPWTCPTSCEEHSTHLLFIRVIIVSCSSRLTLKRKKIIDNNRYKTYEVIFAVLLVILVMPVDVTNFGEAKHYSLSNAEQTLVVKITDYGATITHILVPDKTGTTRDVVLGFDSLEGYRSTINPYFGATIGRVGNRIGGGQFELNNTTYKLDLNNGPNCLHGGLIGFDKRYWTSRITGSNSVEFSLMSDDGDQNFPGALQVVVVYIVVGHELHINYEARLSSSETKSTVINLTNHAYFNLGGASDESTSKITDNFIAMSNSVVGYLEKDNNGMGGVPTGNVIDFRTSDVATDPMYFGNGKGVKIGSRIDQAQGQCYDHCYVIGLRHDERPLVTAWSESTGIKLTFDTSEPSFQFYSGDYNSDQLRAKTSQRGTKNEVELGPRSGFCLEAQRFPDAIHHDDWRSQVILNPGQLYEQRTVYGFGLI